MAWTKFITIPTRGYFLGLGVSIAAVYMCKEESSALIPFHII